MNKNIITCKAFAILVGLAFIGANPTASFADRPAKEEFRERAAPEQQRHQAVSQPVRAENDEWKVKLSGGISEWFPKDEDNETAPALYLDTWNTGMPVNFRVGIEGQHVDLDQDGAENLADGPGRRPRVTFVRIPFAAEYKADLNEATSWYVGGGPDIDVFANDASTTNVGGHLSTRIAYNFDEHWGVSLEGGYMWARFKENDTKINLDGAYVSPLLTYTF